MNFPIKIDLSRGQDPKEFYTCLIPDQSGVEAWRVNPSALDHRIPSSNWCALTCLRMALLLEDGVVPDLEKLWERACERHVYTPKTDGTGWYGAHHEPLARFFGEFGFEAKHCDNMSTASITQALVDGYYVLPSVSPEIRFPRDTDPAKKTGHMVFVYGYDTGVDGRNFLLQNSAGFASLNSQIAVRVSEKRLQQVFSGRAILVRRQNEIL